MGGWRRRACAAIESGSCAGGGCLSFWFTRVSPESVSSCGIGVNASGRDQRRERDALAGAVVVAVQLHCDMGIGEGERLAGWVAGPCLRPFDRARLAAADGSIRRDVTSGLVDRPHASRSGHGARAASDDRENAVHDLPRVHGRSALAAAARVGRR